MISDSLQKIEEYLIREEFKGYDPYDTLNSWIPFRYFGLWVAVLATQFQKRNPLNIRCLLGIKKSVNPKAFGLFLKSYSLLYGHTRDPKYLEKAEYFFRYLESHYSKGYSGYCWGYHFPWASPGKMVDRFVPNAVSTGFIIQGLYEYYLVSGNHKVLEIIDSASKFVLEDLPVTEDEDGICVSYTPLWKDLCFNASLLAAEVLAINFKLAGKIEHREFSIKALEWVISHQKKDGRWNYSINPDTGKERQQIDFHQGYVLVSINSIANLLGLDNPEYRSALENGLHFYRNHQFFSNGVSKWRIPKVWPVEIHNQSQGIITFSLLNRFGKDYLEFARKIAEWTLANMQNQDKGYFYYKKGQFLINKIPFIRWSQAWMFLALITLYLSDKKHE